MPAAPTTLALLIGLSAPARAQAELRPLQAWSLAEGLPQTGVRAVSPDERGGLWLTTQVGPVYFDGLRFRLPEPAGAGRAAYARSTDGEYIQPAAGEASCAVCGLYSITAEGRVFHTRDGQIRRVDLTFDPPDARPDDRLFRLGDALIFRRGERLHLWAPREDGARPRPVPVPALAVIPLSDSPDEDRLWRWSAGALHLERWRRTPAGVVVDVERALELPVDLGHVVMAPDPTGGLLVVAADGLRFVPATGPLPAWSALPVAPWGPTLAPAAKARLFDVPRHSAIGGPSSLARHDHTLWIGGPLGLIEVGPVEALKQTIAERRPVDPRIHPVARTIYELSPAPGGSVWFGTNGAGLMRWTPPSTQVLGESETAGPLTPLPGGGVAARLSCPEDVQGRGPRLLRQRSAGAAVEVLALGAGAACPLTLTATTAGDIWLPVDGGLGRIPDAAWASAEAPQPGALLPLPADAGRPTLLRGLPGGDLLVGTRRGALLRRPADPSAPVELLVEPGETDAPVHDLACPPACDDGPGACGPCWIGRGDDLLRLDPTPAGPPRVTRFPAPGGAEVRDLHLTDDGVVWATTYGDGLRWVDGERQGALGPAQGLLDAFLASMVWTRNPGEAPTAWIHANMGLLRADAEALDRARALGPAARLDGVELHAVGEAEGQRQPSLLGDGRGGFVLASVSGVLQAPDLATGAHPPHPHAAFVGVRVGAGAIGEAELRAAEGAAAPPPEGGHSLGVLDGVLELRLGAERRGPLELRVEAPRLDPLHPPVFVLCRAEGPGPGGWAVVAAGPEGTFTDTPRAPGITRYRAYSSDRHLSTSPSCDAPPAPAAELHVTTERRVTETAAVRGGVLLGALGLSPLVLVPWLQHARRRNERLQREVAERERAEAALALREAHYRGLFQTSAAGLLLFDADGSCLEANPRAEALFGAAPGGLRGLRRRALGIPEEPEADGERRLTCRRVDGEPFPALLGLTLILRDGSPHTLASVLDQTARIAADQALDELQAARRTQALGRVAGGVAHDINNVMTAMQATLAEARAESGPGGPLEPHLDRLEDQAQRAAGLVQRVQAFERRASGPAEDLDAAEVLNGLQPLLQQVAPDDTALRLRLAPGVRVHLPRQELDHIVLHLVLAHVDALPHGGALALELQAHPPGLHLRQDQDPELAARLAAALRAGAEAPSPLRALQSTLRRLQLQPDATPGPGAGSSLWLPLPPAAARPASPPAAPAAWHGAERLLVFDDDDMVRRAAVRTLRRAGYAVTDFGDPVAGVAWFEAHADQIDMVITDVVMPGLNGRQVADRVLALRPATPVLFISGYTAGIVLERGVDGAQVSLLPKPFLPSELGQRVRQMLDARATPADQPGT